MCYKAPGIRTNETFDHFSSPSAALATVDFLLLSFATISRIVSTPQPFQSFPLLWSMSATRPPYDVPTISYDSLPGLTSMQRFRLVRSTHKVAKLLGETPVPQLNLSPESLPPRNKSRDTIRACPRSPIVSLTKKLARTAFEPIQAALRRDPDTNSGPARADTSPRPSPVLFFDAPNLAPVDSRACHISQVSSNSPRSIGPSSRRRLSSLSSISSSESILSPTEYEEQRAARRSRRKRLSKLTRYLGESIPPDLILPNITYSKFTIPTVVPHSAPPLEQGTTFSSTTLPSPVPKFPDPAVVRTVDYSVGSIGRSRINADVTSPRLLARRLRRSHSASTLSLSHERLTLLRPRHTRSRGYSAGGSSSATGAAPGFPSPAAGHFPSVDVTSHRIDRR
jgi:hypothetical protein